MLTVLSRNTFSDFYAYFLELAFLNFLYLDDISYNKIATQSHTYNNYDASRAVDGNTATCMQTSPLGVGSSFK